MHLVVLVLAALASSAHSDSDGLAAGWGMKDGLILGMEDFIGNPLHRALESLPALLGDEYFDSDHVDYDTLLSENDTATVIDDTQLRYYLPSPESDAVSEKCRHDVDQILLAQNHSIKLITAQKLWHIMLPDSWGKFPDGVLSGNMMPLGMMEECTGLNVDDHTKIGGVFSDEHMNATFKGKYCMVIHSVWWDHMQDRVVGSPIAGNIPNAIFGGPTYGTCMPDSCSEEDFTVSLEEALPEGKKVYSVYCHTKDEEIIWEPKDVAFVSIFGILVFIVVAAACIDLSVDYFDAQDLRKGPLRFCLAFSAYSNMSKIFFINTKPNATAINCLHGIRVLSMTWIVWGHNYAFEANLVENPLGMKYVFGGIMGQTIMNAVLAVDSFFFLSGLLVAYNLMKQKDKMDLYNFAMFYIHRILRLLPPIAMMCFFSATVARFFNTGPLSEIINESNIYRCNSDWWYDVLFINNIAQKWCLEQTWYTSVDMQIYVLVPIIFFPIMYYGKFGAMWLGAVTLISMIVPTVLTDVYKLPLTSIVTDYLLQKDWAFYYYFASWSRAGPYMVGLWAGYILYKTNKKPLELKQWQVALGWVSAIAIGLLVCYGIYPYNKIGDNNVLGDGNVPPQALSDIYNGFGRAAWGLVLLWVVLACHSGNGGLVNSFLGHPSWQPLSRLTYPMFLVSVTVEALLLGSEFRLGYYNHLSLLFKTCGVLFISGIGATVLSLLTEGPIVNLEKLLLTRPEVKPSISTTELITEDKAQNI